MARRMFDTPVLPRLETVLAEVASGDLAIPVFQREFLWDDDRRLQLLDSIEQGMPIGSLLVWRTSEHTLESHKRVGPFQIAPWAKARESASRSYLIDGLQRVATLFGALYPSGLEEPRLEGEPIWSVYYDLGSAQRPRFKLWRSSPRPPPPAWLPLRILFDGDALYLFTSELRKHGRREEAKRAENLSNLFKDYIVPVIPLASEDLNVVTEAFIRISSQGLKMGEAEMLRVLTFNTDIDTGKAFQDIHAALDPLGWGGLDDQVLVNALKAQLGLDVYSASVRELRERLRTQDLRYLQASLERAVGFLGTVGVRGPSALPYTYQLVTLASLFADEGSPTEQQQSALQRWFWATTYTGYFAGATGNRIRDGILELRRRLEAAEPDLVPEDIGTISRLRRFHSNTTRSLAFLLFMCRLAPGPDEQARRQDLLAASGEPARRLISRRSLSDPGNPVLASTRELQDIQAQLDEVGQQRRGRLSLFSSPIRTIETTESALREFAIPRSALECLPDESAFLDARRKWLQKSERQFLGELGLDHLIAGVEDGGS